MIKILIDIDENVYTRLYDNELLVSDCLEVCKAVKNGEIVEQEDSVGGEYGRCREKCDT